MTTRRDWLIRTPYTPKKRRPDPPLESTYMFNNSAFRGDAKALDAHLEKLRKGNKR